MTEPLYMVLGSGQSLRYGAEGSPPITTTSRYKGLMPGNDIRAINGSLNPLIAPVRETIDVGMSDYIFSRSSKYLPNILFTENGIPGAGYLSMKKGTGAYNELLGSVRNAVRQSPNKQVIVLAATIINGENDHCSSPFSRPFLQDLLEWQSDIDADVRSITGQSQSIPFLLCQMSSFDFYGKLLNDSCPRTPATTLWQLEAARRYPDRFKLVTPKYCFDYATNISVHLSASGYRHLGQYYGRVLLDLMEGRDWMPLHPTKVSWLNPATIRTTFAVPTGKLRWETSWVSQQTNNGFEYWETGDLIPAIQSTTLVDDGKSVDIKLNAPARSGGGRLRYAYSIPPDPPRPPYSYPANPPVNACGRTYGPRGNLCDSETLTGFDGQTLANYCVHFDERVT
jgi:hypothetical protein